jgi:hypothetical protein
MFWLQSRVVFVCALATQTAPQATAPDIIVTLLEQSHNLDQLVAPSQRLQLLGRQTEMVSRYRADLGGEWASELLELSHQQQGWSRGYAQQTALTALSRLDTNSALALLDRPDLEESPPNSAGFSVQGSLANRIFSTVIERDGLAALPLVEQAADRLGTKGHYPYGALGYAAMQAANPFWGNNQQRGVDILRLVLDPSFARYKQAPNRFEDDVEFGTMLQVLAGGLPLEVVQPGLHEFVHRILAMDQSAHPLEVDVTTRDGRSVKSDNAIDATLTYFGALVNRDQELVQHLVAARPSLQPGLEATKEANLQSIRFGPSFNHTGTLHRGSQNQTAGQRNNALLDAARNAAGEHPEKAAALIESVDLDTSSPDALLQLNLISAQVSVTASQAKTQELRALLERGFELATQVSDSAKGDAPGHFTPGLAPMVQIGIQNQRELTLTFLQSYPPSGEKAELLLAAASALDMPVHLPIGSPQTSPIPKPTPIK